MSRISSSDVFFCPCDLPCPVGHRYDVLTDLKHSCAPELHLDTLWNPATTVERSLKKPFRGLEIMSAAVTSSCC